MPYVDLFSFFVVHIMYYARGFVGSTRFDLYLCAIVFVDGCILRAHQLAYLILSIWRILDLLFHIIFAEEVSDALSPAKYHDRLLDISCPTEAPWI